jgi:hypothetical protein
MSAVGDDNRLLRGLVIHFGDFEAGLLKFAD